MGRTRLLTNVGNPSSLQVKREQFLQGWLAGKGNRAVCAYSVPNASENPERDFRMEAEAQLSAMLEIRETGLDLTATYHSHPRTPAEASARDLALAAYPTPSTSSSRWPTADRKSAATA